MNQSASPLEWFASNFFQDTHEASLSLTGTLKSFIEARVSGFDLTWFKSLREEIAEFAKSEPQGSLVERWWMLDSARAPDDLSISTLCECVRILDEFISTKSI